LTIPALRATPFDKGEEEKKRGRREEEEYL